MITGFNTDIEFQGVTYHVQTEDKGLDTPLILSLVYDRGTILASKRSPYDDLLKSEFNEKELAERLQRQHKLICAAVRAGRIDDLKQMTLKEAAAKREKKEAAKSGGKLLSENTAAKPAKSEILPSSAAATEIPMPQALSIPSLNGDGKKSVSEVVSKGEEIKKFEENVLEIPISVLEDLIIEDVEIVEEPVLAAEVVEILPVNSPHIEEPADESLHIELLNEISFKAGERKTLSVLVKRTNIDKGLSGAHVMVKVFGTSFRPLIFHAKTDSNGVATVHLQLPYFSGGRAAILIRAMSGGEEVELRRSISQD